MNPLRHWIFHLFAALSIVVFFIALDFLIRGFFIDDRFSLQTHDHWNRGFDSTRGSIRIFSFHSFFKVLTRSSTNAVTYSEREIQPSHPANGLSYEQFPIDSFKLGFHFGKIDFPNPQSLPPPPAIPGPGGTSGISTGAIRGWQFTIPDWFILLAAAILPCLWWRIHRKKTPPPGFCPTCGYDLRATPNQCPECGAIPASQKPI